MGLGACLGTILTEQILHSLPSGNARRSLSRCTFGPLGDLAEADSVLDPRPFDGDDEFGCWGRAGDHRVLTEFLNRQRNGFVQRLGLHVCSVGDAFGVFERDAAASERHSEIITLYSLFIRFGWQGELPDLPRGVGTPAIALELLKELVEDPLGFLKTWSRRHTQLLGVVASPFCSSHKTNFPVIIIMNAAELAMGCVLLWLGLVKGLDHLCS